MIVFTHVCGGHAFTNNRNLTRRILFRCYHVNHNKKIDCNLLVYSGSVTKHNYVLAAARKPAMKLNVLVFSVTLPFCEFLNMYVCNFSFHCFIIIRIACLAEAKRVLSSYPLQEAATVKNKIIRIPTRHY
jgi:hypothetical protein